jgi:histidyl-tRNA synthetase
VFEWTTTQLGSQGTVLAGGRYDGLVEQLGGQPTPAVGWASGIERLILLMQAQGQQASSAPLVYVCHVDQRRAAARLAESLRDTGISTVLDMGEAKFKTQLQRADRHAATFAVILGSEEVAKGTVQVKTLATAEQHEIESSQLAAWLQAQNPSQELSQKL